MPNKDPEKKRAAWRAWYHRTKNTDHQKRLRRERRKRIYARLGALDRKRQAVFELIERTKFEGQCLRCGLREPEVLVFHHRAPGEKLFAIGSALRQKIDPEAVRAEIAKCDLLCANCHIKLHFDLQPDRSHAIPLRKRSQTLLARFLSGEFDVES